MRISDWSSDVCSSDLAPPLRQRQTSRRQSWHRRRALRSCAASRGVGLRISWPSMHRRLLGEDALDHLTARARARRYGLVDLGLHDPRQFAQMRSEEHTSELQSLMRISYAVFCLTKKKQITTTITHTNTVHHIHRITIKYT